MAESSNSVLEYQPIGLAESPLRELLGLALPTVAQMASYTVMQFIDTWMLSRSGPVAPAAASNAGMFAFAFIGFGMGVLFLVNTMASQSFGAKRFDHCGRAMWQGMWFAVAYSLAIGPVVLAAPMLMRRFNHSVDMTALETVYFQIIVATAAVKLVQTAASQFLLATNRPTVVMVAAIIGVLVNAVMAYALVFGRLGFSSHGIAGAGWAQAIGVSVECAIEIAVSLIGPNRKRFGAGDWRFRWSEFKTLVKLGFGSGVQFIVDISAWSMFMLVVIALFKEKAMAANAFMFRYLIVSFMPVWGLSQAVTALVGRYIGAGRPDLAKRRADLGFAVGVVYLFGCAAIYIVAQLIGVFTTDAEVIAMGSSLLMIAAFYQFTDALFIIYNGALRGAGDTFIPACLTAVSSWLINVLGGYSIGRFLPQLGVQGPWIAATLNGIIVGSFMILRFKRGKWVKPIEDGNSKSPNHSVTLSGLEVSGAT